MIKKTLYLSLKKHITLHDISHLEKCKKRIKFGDCGVGNALHVTLAYIPIIEYNSHGTLHKLTKN